MVNVAIPRDQRKSLNEREARRASYWGLRSRDRARRTRRAKSVQRAAKTARLNTCHDTPAIMMLIPVCWVEPVALAAIPPPAAWSKRAMKSPAMKR